MAFGGLFALVVAFANGRAAALGARAVSALLSLAGLVSFTLVPSLKYPANPPSVGHPDTIGMRTEFYFIMIGLGGGPQTPGADAWRLVGGTGG